MIVGWVVRVGNGRLFGPFSEARLVEAFIRRYCHDLTGSFVIEPLFNPDVSKEE